MVVDLLLERGAPKSSTTKVGNYWAGLITFLVLLHLIVQQFVITEKYIKLINVDYSRSIDSYLKSSFLKKWIFNHRIMFYKFYKKKISICIFMFYKLSVGQCLII